MPPARRRRAQVGLGEAVPLVAARRRRPRRGRARRSARAPGGCAALSSPTSPARSRPWRRSTRSSTRSPGGASRRRRRRRSRWLSSTSPASASGRPLWSLLGAPEAAPVTCNATLASRRSGRRRRRRRALGEATASTTFKLKLGSGDDVAQVRAVREAVGPEARIRIDANGAWSADEALGDPEAARAARHRAGRAAGREHRRAGDADRGADDPDRRRRDASRR